jgi:hypothetical protein
MTLYLILSFRQGLPSKFTNPAFDHLISLMGLFLKIRILLFSEEPLLITV